jgi:hypothetical protein
LAFDCAMSTRTTLKYTFVSFKTSKIFPRIFTVDFVYRRQSRRIESYTCVYSNKVNGLNLGLGAPEEEQSLAYREYEAYNECPSISLGITVIGQLGNVVVRLQNYKDNVASREHCKQIRASNQHRNTKSPN